jgi:hypothetical protein
MGDGSRPRFDRRLLKGADPSIMYADRFSFEASERSQETVVRIYGKAIINI